MCVSQRQRLVQEANGFETAVVDGKPDIENGNVPEDQGTEDKENELNSPFTLPGEEHTQYLQRRDNNFIKQLHQIKHCTSLVIL